LRVLKKVLLPVVFALLAWGFWLSPEFKEIAAGVAIFLFGMMALEEGFKAFTGGVLEKLLDASTDKLWKSLSFGMAVSTVMQSSSLVSVITISFLSAGLIGLAPGLGIIFGANIGTTTGAWLVAGVGLNIDIAAYAMPLVVFGVILLFQGSKALKGVGYILAGIGFLFLGIHYMKTGFETFQGAIDLSRFAVPGLAGLLIYTVVGIVATVIMQSSHATLILAITALAAGQITYENSLAIAIGSNVGTTVTALLGAMSANVAGKRLAVAHLIFNVTTGLIAIVFIGFLARAVDAISGVIGIAADDYTLKFAVFHTLFNVIGVAIITPLIDQLVRLLEWLLPDKPLDVSVPHYLNDAALGFPDTALKAIVQEAGHLYRNAFGVMALGLGLRESDLRSDRDLAEIVRTAPPPPDVDLEDLYERRVKGLYGAIVEFASRAESEMVPEQVELLSAIRAVVRGIVLAIKDVKHLHKNMQRYVRSSNIDIRGQYNDARLFVARVLRATAQIADDQDAALAALAAIGAEIDDFDIVESGKLDQLIRERRITPAMATSLLNDSGYVMNISRKLSEAGLIVLRNKTYDFLQQMRAATGGQGSGTAVADAVVGIEARAQAAP
jgi:phosphate:Na+ symporter